MKMAQTERGKEFEGREPLLNDDEIVRAAETAQIVASLKGKPVVGPRGDIGYIAVKFALYDGSFVTMLFDRVAASAFAAHVQSADRINWDGNALKPGQTAH
jgi:hypothetical protein